MRRTLGNSSEHNLLIADSGNSEGHYANAILIQYFIATAGHVAEGNPAIVKPDGSDKVTVSFRYIAGRDLAISCERTVSMRGYTKLQKPTVGQTFLICGHHGLARAYYEIQAKVVAIGKDKRILVEAVSRNGVASMASGGRRLLVPDDFEKVFQLGMSGSPGLTASDAVVGLLTAHAPGDFEGHRAYLEPATELQ